MSFTFGSSSTRKLSTVHPHLRQVAIRALERTPYDFAIIHGWRGRDVQNALEASGASTKRFPDSKHNKSDDPNIDEPEKVSDAIDFAPYVAGQKIQRRRQKRPGATVTLRWGGDWDGDANTKEHKLQDWGHLEIVHNG